MPVLWRPGLGHLNSASAVEELQTHSSVLLPSRPQALEASMRAWWGLSWLIARLKDFVTCDTMSLLLYILYVVRNAGVDTTDFLSQPPHMAPQLPHTLEFWDSHSYLEICCHH